MIMNPNGRDINDTKMRCLVKTLSLFGVGFHIYQGKIQPEDTFNDDLDEPAPAPAPAKKQAPKAPAPAPAPEPVKDTVAEDFDPKEWVTMTLEVAAKFGETPNGLRELWKANKKKIDELDTHHPEQYTRLKEAFTELRDNLSKKEEAQS